MREFVSRSGWMGAGFQMVLSGLAVNAGLFWAGQRSRVISATGGINGIGGRGRLSFLFVV
jgi:hypothetical protein